MARLTPQQLAFLYRHKIPLSLVFDATGMTKAEYSVAMARDNRHFAFGVSPCENAGHTLRTRSGNCIECNTANIAFQRRHGNPADVYLAASISQQLFKIGSSTEVDRRLKNLNKVSYGGASDWFCIAKARCKEAGKVEFDAQKRLEGFRFVVPYTDSGREIEADELFACRYITARIAFIKAVPEEQIPDIWHLTNAEKLCEFSDRPHVT